MKSEGAPPGVAGPGYTAKLREFKVTEQVLGSVVIARTQAALAAQPLHAPPQVQPASAPAAVGVSVTGVLLKRLLHVPVVGSVQEMPPGALLTKLPVGVFGLVTLESVTVAL